jgi:[NiFe] hydrogenase assembly HybE family chaperone
MTVSEKGLVRRYQSIYRKKMRDLPICNSALRVQTVGFRALDEHRLGVLITPWFMNLVLLPGDTTWSDAPAGSTERLSLPSEDCEFVINHDEILGTCLSAVLFRTLRDFPGQDTAVAIAEKVMEQLFVPAATMPSDTGSVQNFSRRSLLTGMGAS